jgi:hypothetical protein
MGPKGTGANLKIITSGVGDPDPETDPHVFGPPGSGSISQRHGSKSFPFLIKVLSGLKNAQNFSKKLNFQD